MSWYHESDDKARTRAYLAMRDGPYCGYCGQVVDIDDGTKTHLDHKQPRSRGGTDNDENLVLACASCNLFKGTRTWAEVLPYFTAAWSDSPAALALGA